MPPICAVHDPLATVSEDYGAAVLHLVWDVDRKTRERTLLCGAVELLPHEIPAPLERSERHTELSENHFLYTSDRVLTVSDGLGWFAQAASGMAPRPAPDGSIDLSSDRRFACQEVDAEPVAPLLSTTDLSIPFSARWHAHARVRHLIASSFRVQSLWSDSERERAVEWLANEIHFDFSDYEEFWGSSHLIAPNPVLRSHSSRVDRTVSPYELVCAIEFRDGMATKDLLFEFESRSSTGTTFIVQRRLEREIERIPIPADPEEIYERIIDPRRGLLCMLGPARFMGGVSMTMNLANAVRHVAVPLQDGSDGSYKVPLVSGEGVRSQVGEIREAGAAAVRLREGISTRRRRSRGRASQQWFRDQVPDATRRLRELIQGVQRSLWIFDPYLEGDDLKRVVLAVSSTAVPVRVLGGAEHLRSHNAAAVEQSEHLAACAEEARLQGRMTRLEIRVMPGSKPPLHDRFMLVDEQLWMLGSSLNAFGSRGTMLVGVPDPDPVVTDLMVLWTDAVPFDAWIAERRENRKDDASVE